MSLRIVLADDHPIVANGARQLLAQDPTLQVVSVANSPDELLQMLDQAPCDLVVTDFSMPGGNAPDGLAMLGLLRRRWPDLAIIVLTRIENPAVLRSIRDTGVRGLINKTDALSELPHAVHAVAHGRTYIGRAARQLLESAATGLQTAASAALSPREAEVLRLFASGMSVKDISKQLNRSAKTISNQKLAAMDKLGIKTDLEIYAYAAEHGLLS
ncbi:response regulator transcription factor [Lysobacter sp. LF1]|uniref:Response regulator transcription factor n=1 Tax=Lysobacter stagni TaxID=3045172 RepID=A0ABT6XCR9_9GAMM|nr:response regulator transcription factor [Lysobacter sp. LF1]MDI9237939.1 response regulator transcription factor [Lysobacter sp. LF1]